MKNSKGITLIELILALALIGIILTPIFSFLLSNLRAFDKQDTEIQLSSEAQSIMNFITNKSIEFSKINNPITGNKINNYEKYVDNIEFNDKNIFYIENNQFKYSNNGNVTEVGNYVQYFKISLIPNTIKLNQYSSADGINFTIVLNKDNTTKEVKSQIYFRNKE